MSICCRAVSSLEIRSNGRGSLFGGLLLSVVSQMNQNRELDVYGTNKSISNEAIRVTMIPITVLVFAIFQALESSPIRSILCRNPTISIFISGSNSLLTQSRHTVRRRGSFLSQNRISYLFVRGENLDLLDAMEVNGCIDRQLVLYMKLSIVSLSPQPFYCANDTSIESPYFSRSSGAGN